MTIIKQIKSLQYPVIMMALCLLCTGTNLSAQQSRSYYWQGRSQPVMSWEYSRVLSEHNGVREYTFHVEEDIKRFSINVSGSCKSGEIEVEVLQPDKEHYSDITIDEFGSMNWRKSFDIKEDTKERLGVWTFRVSSTDATGSFKLSVQAY